MMNKSPMTIRATAMAVDDFPPFLICADLPSLGSEKLLVTARIRSPEAQTYIGVTPQRLRTHAFKSDSVTKHVAVLHDETHVLDGIDVRDGIAGNRHNVGVSAGSDDSEFAFLIQQLGSARSCRLDGLHRRHAKFHHVVEFLGDRLRPGNSAHVGAERNLDSGLQRLLERDFVNGCPGAVALSVVRVLRRPIAVIDSNGGYVPGALFQHLADGLVIEIQPVLDRIAAAIQRPVQPDSTIGMARDLLAPTMRLVRDRLDLLQCQGRLRNQMALFVGPGAVRHVDLDPVGAVIELLPCDLAEFDRAIAELRAFGDHDIGVVAFERISAGGGDGAGHHKQPRSGNVPGVDGFFESDIAVPGAFGLKIAQSCETLLQSATHGHSCPCRAKRPRMLQQLDVVSAFGGILTLKKNVGVRVDQAGQNGNLRAEIDYGGIRRCSTFAYAGNAVTPHRDHYVVPDLCGGAVDQVGGTNDCDFLRRGGRLLCDARREQARQNSRENDSAVYHLAIPPVSERNMNTPLKNK